MTKFKLLLNVKIRNNEMIIKILNNGFEICTVNW